MVVAHTDAPSEAMLAALEKHQALLQKEQQDAIEREKEEATLRRKAQLDELIAEFKATGNPTKIESLYKDEPAIEGDFVDRKRHAIATMERLEEHDGKPLCIVNPKPGPDGQLKSMTDAEIQDYKARAQEMFGDSVKIITVHTKPDNLRTVGLVGLTADQANAIQKATFEQRELNARLEAKTQQRDVEAPAHLQDAVKEAKDPDRPIGEGYDGVPKTPPVEQEVVQKRVNSL